MSHKEWTALVQLVSGLGVALWLVLGLANGTPRTASQLLWAIGAIIAFNIAAIIVVTIGVAVVRREHFKDEPADERDEAIDARSGRIAYAVTSVLAAGTLVPLAAGVDVSLAVTMLFAAPLGGGLAHAISQLVHYRIG